MPDEELKQKLTAILSADVKEYSRLMSQDRVGTIDSLKSHRVLFSDFINKYGGKVIDNPGDEILAAFESVSDAVNCAVEIQRELAERNAEIPSARMMQWRIGISLGEVIEEESRIYGDGVNIAGRIQSLTDPAGICISGTVYDHVKDKLGLEYESLGEQEVKNIPDPVRVFRVLSYPGAAAHRVTKAKADLKKSWRNKALISIAVIILGIGSILTWNYISQKAVSPIQVAVTEKAVASATKPSIAVLPFDNMSDDLSQEYFSEGMSEEIINGLAKNPGLIVKGRTSSFSDMVRHKDIKTIAELLNVTHVVEGSVRKSGNRIRIAAQLIDTVEDAHIWSDKYDRELTDVFEIQDEIAGEILTALNIHLVGSAEKQIRTASMEAYNAFLLGRYHYNLFHLEEAVTSFEKAASIDPKYADAYGMLASTHILQIRIGLGSLREELSKVSSHVNKALSLDPYQPSARSARSYVSLLIDHTYQAAINELYGLIRRYPNDDSALRFLAYALEIVGRFDLSLKVCERMIELDPLNASLRREHGFSSVLLGDLGLAQISFERMGMLGDDQPVFLAWLAFLEGDSQAIRKHLNLGKTKWKNLKHWYPFFEAATLYIEGDRGGMRDVLASMRLEGNLANILKSYMATLSGDLDLALQYYTQAVWELNFSAFRGIQKPPYISNLFPEYRSHPKYQKMLRDVGLDDESIGKLKIPPLPF